MRASLARHGRYIVARHASVSIRVPHTSTLRRRVVSRQPVCKSFERTFLNFLWSKPPRKVRDLEYDPGWPQIMTWQIRRQDNLRPPSRKELIAAWKSLMQSKLRAKAPLTSTQAVTCRKLLEYLATPPTSEQNVKQLSSADLAMARQVLLDTHPIERTRQFSDFAKAIHAAVTGDGLSGKSRNDTLQWSYLVQAMSKFCDAQEASKELQAKWDEEGYHEIITGEKKVLEAVLEGLAREGAEADLMELTHFALSRGIAYTPTIQSIVTTFFATRDRVPETKEWFTKTLDAGHGKASTYRAVASFARRNNLKDWALPLFQQLGELHPRKGHWDALLHCMLLVGIPLKEIEGMLPHMVNQGNPLEPDINSINSLLQVSVETSDEELAKSIIAIAEDMQIQPNEYTYLILLELHLNLGSIDNSATAFHALQDQGTILESSASVLAEYGDVVNRFLQLVSAERPPDFTFILELLNTFEEQGVHLKPETLAPLCVLFLENQQPLDVMDILAVHAFHYSETQRDVMQQAFVDYILSSNTSTARAWETYQLTHQYFPELMYEHRVQLLQGFFDRRRPDMSLYVFGHMKQHESKSVQPTLDTYVQIFEGFAKNPDRQGVENVHNMFKMDVGVRPNTRLHTALMLAFTSCGMPRKALDMWNLIKQSQEGPSYATLEAVFWACEKLSGGSKQAREVWQKIEDMDLEVPLSVYNAYVAAVAGDGNEKEVRTLIVKTASIVGTEPDIMTLGLAYNALPGQELQKNFKAWAEKRYPEQWTTLMKKRRRVTEMGLCAFSITRPLKAA